MIEWNICKDCQKFVELDKDTCPSCGGCTEKYTIDFLKNYFNQLVFLVKTLDVIKQNSPLKEVNFDTVILDDLFKWFSYLGLGDGIITDNELEFINTLLDTTYSKDDISNLADINLDDCPQSFKYSKDLSEFAVEFGIDGLPLSQQLYETYKLAGGFLLTVDGVDVDEKVLEKYNSYMKRLEDKFGGFKREVKIQSDSIEEIPENPKEEEKQTLDDYLDELNKLIGLEKVKKDVNSLINMIQIRKLRDERGIKQPAMSLHLVFSGNPGTGKTTVARLLSKIYHEIGLLSEGHLVETDRSGLVGGYVGQTAIKTQEVIQKAMGGILFIDEAYSLTSKSENDYGGEAIDTLLKAMEDNRDDLIVIVAGYPELMDNFLNSNPGLESRFNKFIYFEDYTSDELYDIFRLMCSESNLTIDEAGDKYVKEYFVRMCENKGPNFANGRAVRNFFEEVITAQANRLAPQKDITDEELNTLTYEDFLVE